ncbi:hypothetical protein [Yinghuangia sp. YIM S09857]|uniref:hypothetical protein n=1 Tax=Yinghuangia sp. YIM S09857 TaxID=3436929 RepID=UPI003F5399C8
MLATACAGLAVLAVPQTAAAAPGDNGDVKIHATTTEFDDQRDEPKVCRFYLAAFNFDTVQKVSWAIDPQPAKQGGAHLAGDITLATGTGHSGPLSLPNGQYKLTWNFEGQSGQAKQKVFKVSCVVISNPPGGTTGGTSGGSTGATTGGADHAPPMVRDVFGNLVPAGGADTGSGSTASMASNSGQIAAGAAIALGAVLLGGRLLRRHGRNRPGSR